MSDASSPLVVFTDVQSGSAFLARLPLANPVVAEQQLMVFLDSLLANPPESSVLFTLLEQARVPLCFVEEEMARRYHNKPLPLGEVEEAAFQQVVEAWQKMCKAYALSAQLEHPDTEDARYAALVATILQRCLYYTGMTILEHFRARRELPPGVWLDFHGYFATAEEWGVAAIPVEDALEHETQATHCMAAYVTLLLIDAAGPYSHSVRDLNLIRRWAGLWAPLVNVHALSDEREVPPYVVETMKDTGLHPTPPETELTENARFLDAAHLGLQMNHLLTLLRQKITPSQLGLGEETNTHVTRLLEELFRPWTQQAAVRKFRRFQASGTARVALGFEAMHYLISGEEFERPDSAQTYSRAQFDQLYTFRDRVDPGQKLTIKQQPNYPVDQWDVINHSANGFRLGRSCAGQKMAHSQLLTLCPHDGQNFLLAQASWLMQEANGGLIAGVAVLPGMPVGIAVRLANQPKGSAETFERAFLLPAVPAIQAESSLVIPAGMYVASRVLDVYQDGSWQVKLKSILQRGVDFERVSFEVV